MTAVPGCFRNPLGLSYGREGASRISGRGRLLSPKALKGSLSGGRQAGDLGLAAQAGGPGRVAQYGWPSRGGPVRVAQYGWPRTLNQK